MRAINLFLLAAMIGVELILGIVVAPVIFHPQNLIGEGVLTSFQSGQMMSEIFSKMGWVLLGVSIFNFLFELSFFFSKKEKFSLRFSRFMSSLLVLILALVFVFYFTSYILEAQKIGLSAVQNANFAQIHSASEVTMKIIVVLQFILFFLGFQSGKK